MEILKQLVIDSDAFNEIDDQFAIAYALNSPQFFEVKALLAAPFFNEKSASPGDGMEKSLCEIKRVTALCESGAPAFAGARDYLPANGQAVESPACDELIRLVKATPPGRRLYVAAIGALTNIASALIKAPEIRDRMTVYWLGANAVQFQDQNEFNLRQDRRAAQTLFDSGTPVVWFPCRGVCSHLSLSLWEAEHWLAGRGKLAGALCGLLRQSGAVGMGQSRILWDIAPIAALCNPACVQTVELPSPIVAEGPLRLLPTRPAVQYVQAIARDLVFKDFFAAIGGLARERYIYSI